jgi:hypothetical protein
LEDGGTAPTRALHHSGEHGERRDRRALRGCRGQWVASAAIGWAG